MRAKLAAFLTGVVLAGALIFAGCGGDRNRAEGSAAPPSTSSTAAAVAVKVPHAPPVSAEATDPARRRYIAKADRVCARYDPKRNEARRRTGEAADSTEAAHAYDDGIKLGVAQLRALLALPVPPRDAGALRANVFEPLRAELRLRRAIVPALAANDLTRLRPLQRRLDALTQSLDGFARGYGYRVCGVR